VEEEEQQQPEMGQGCQDCSVYLLSMSLMFLPLTIDTISCSCPFRKRLFARLREFVQAALLKKANDTDHKKEL
jgi:hypothetical protein